MFVSYEQIKRGLTTAQKYWESPIWPPLYSSLTLQQDTGTASSWIQKMKAQMWTLHVDVTHGHFVDVGQWCATFKCATELRDIAVTQAWFKD